jgi:hypothetical protein
MDQWSDSVHNLWTNHFTHLLLLRGICTLGGLFFLARYISSIYEYVFLIMKLFVPMDREAHVFLYHRKCSFAGYSSHPIRNKLF